MESLGDIISDHAKSASRPVGDRALAASVILANVNRVLPEGFVAKTLRDGIVTIEAPSASQGYFFRHEVDDYLEKIQAAVPKSGIVKIRLKIGKY